MSVIDQNSCECVKSELDLFSVPSTQTSIDQTRYEKIYPLNTITDTGPLEFRFSTGDKDYVDLQNTFLYIKARILNNDKKIYFDLKLCRIIIGNINMLVNEYK